MLVFPTLFQLLKDDHKIAFNKNISKFPAANGIHLIAVRIYVSGDER